MTPQPTFWRTAAVALTTVLLLACTDGATTPSNSVSFTAQIDGAAFAAGARESDFSLYDGGTRLFVAGVEQRAGRSRQLSLDVGDWRGVGAYPIGVSDGMAFVIERDSSGGGAPSVTRWETTPGDIGQLIVDRYDAEAGRIGGRFSFRATNGTGQTINVTNGSFDGRLFVDP
jgi:hypothetical protein